MKKLLITLLAALLLAEITPAQAQLTYITNNDTITITGYSGGGFLNLPSVISGLPVTSIGDNAFYGNTAITGITIPNSVTSIGNYAFYDNTAITGITIPNSVTSIGSYAFSYCAMSSITIPNSVTNIGNAAFSDSGLSNMTIPSSVTSIPGYAFYYCGNLTSVTIGSGVTSIGNLAFYNCNNLTNVNFQGNSPTPNNDTSVFSFDPLATAYFQAGTTGWGSTFDGIPTALQSGGGGMPGVSPALGIGTYSNNPAVFFPAVAGSGFSLQMTTNLGSSNWVTVSGGITISGVIITNPPPNAFFRLH